jgi:hypothetical protein
MDQKWSFMLFDDEPDPTNSGRECPHAIHAISGGNGPLPDISLAPTAITSGGKRKRPSSSPDGGLALQLGDVPSTREITPSVAVPVPMLTPGRRSQSGVQKDRHTVEEMQEFRDLLDRLGLTEAIKQMEHRVKPFTLYAWAADHRKLKPLPRGHTKSNTIRQRRAGGGKPGFFSPVEKQDIMVKVKDRFEASKRPVTLAFVRGKSVAAAAAKGQFASTSHPGGPPQSSSWVQKLFRSNNFANELAGSKGSKPVSASERDAMSASVAAAVGEVHKFRRDFVTNHGNDFSREFADTAHRVISFDEVGHVYDTQEKEGFTVNYCTGGNGDVYVVLVIFANKSQPEHSVITVEGVTFFVVYNSTHWNNAIVQHEFTRVLFSQLPQCPCTDPACYSHIVLFDRFAGHFTDDIKQQYETRRIKWVVVEHTPLGNPNDTIFNKEIKKVFGEMMSSYYGQREAQSAMLEKADKEALPPYTPEDVRQLALYALRYAL